MGKYTKSARKKETTRNIIIAVVVGLLILGFSGVYFFTGLPETEQVTNSQVISERIDVEQAHQLYSQGVYTLDVRTIEEWQQVHIPGATLIPLDQLPDRYQELPTDEPILIYCRSGNRSLQALNILKDLGLDDLSSMDGGINDWIAAGYPVE